MMDRTDSFLASISCNAACAERVHEGAAIYFAGVRCNANPARFCTSGNKEEHLHHGFSLRGRNTFGMKWRVAIWKQR
jgi:hypothetical protein